MYSGVGRLLSPKYRRRTPSMVMAISASSRIRERGTISTEVAILGIFAILALPRFIMSLHVRPFSSRRHHRRVLAGYRNRRPLHDRTWHDGRRPPHGVRQKHRRPER